MLAQSAAATRSALAAGDARRRRERGRRAGAARLARPRGRGDARQHARLDGPGGAERLPGRDRPGQGSGRQARRGGADQEGRRQGRRRRLSALGRRARAAQGQRPQARRGAGGRRRRAAAGPRPRHFFRHRRHLLQALDAAQRDRAPAVRELRRSRLRARPSDPRRQPDRQCADAGARAARRRARPPRHATRAAASSPRCWRAPAPARRSATTCSRCSPATTTPSTAATCARWSRKRRPRASAASARCASAARRAARCSRRSGSTPTCRSSTGASSWRASRSSPKWSTSCTRSRAGAPSRASCPGSRR